MKLLHDLRRRRIFRLTGLYVVASWVTIEGASVLFPAWGIPDTALRYLVMAAVLCFPIALVFGWTYDLTSEGIVRTRDAQASEDVDLSLRRTDYLILLMLFVAGAYVLWGSANQVADEIESVVDIQKISSKLENSVAVLPFINLDSNPDTAYFSDGVTEEILHRLSAIKALHILSSASSFAFRGSDVGSDRISEILGVRYLLHGSVRRDGDFVRITSRLINDSGFQVWSQTYDRELKGIFVIQSEIASAVSTQVANQIIPMAQSPDGRTTENMDAYDAYLIGKAFITARTPGWQASAIEAFSRAIDLDPNYAAPYAGLAVAATVGRSSYDDSLLDPLPAALRAIELDPELAEGHAALGLVYLSGPPEELPASVTALRRALELDPSNANAYNWLAGALNDQGLDAESDAVQDQGISIDPLNAALSVNIGNRYLQQGNAERAEQLMLRLTFLPDTPGLAYWELVNLYTTIGRFDEALRWSKELVRGYAKTNNVQMFATLSSTYQRLGMAADANYWMDEFQERVSNPVQKLINYIYLLKLQGDAVAGAAAAHQMTSLPNADKIFSKGFTAAVLGAALIQTGGYDQGISIFESAFDVTTLSIISELGSVDAFDFAHNLAYAYQQVGRHDDADALLSALRARLHRLIDDLKFNYGPTYEMLALNHALSNDYATTYDYLARAIDVGWGNYYWIRNDRMWSVAVARPEFVKLLGDVQLRIAEQRAKVEATDAEHNFRAEIAAHDKQVSDQSP